MGGYPAAAHAKISYSYTNDLGFAMTGLETVSAGSQLQHAQRIAGFPKDLLYWGESEQDSFDCLAGYVVGNVQKTMTTCSLCLIQ